MPDYYCTISYPQDVLAEGQARNAPPALLGHTNWWVAHTFETNMRTMVVSPHVFRGRRRLGSYAKPLPNRHKPLPPLRTAYTAYARTQTLEPLPPTPSLPTYTKPRHELDGMQDALGQHPPRSATVQWHAQKDFRKSMPALGGTSRASGKAVPTEAEVNAAMAMLREKLMTRDVKASAAFRRYDKDKNNKLDKDEVVLMLRENNLLDQFQAGPPGLIDAVVRAIDADGENNIEFREVCALAIRLRSDAVCGRRTIMRCHERTSPGV